MELQTNIVLRRCFQPKSLPTTGFSKEGRVNCGGQTFVMPKGNKPLPSLESLKEHFTYDPKTGNLTWKKWRPGGIVIGAEVGWEENTGYRCVGFFGDTYLVHRIIYKLHTGVDPLEQEVDHQNTIKNDNRFSNLRLATSGENQRNHRKNKANTSGFKGVSYHKDTQKWRAYVTLDYRQRYIGLFPSPESAAEAIRTFRANLHKQFTNHG